MKSITTCVRGRLNKFFKIKILQGNKTRELIYAWAYFFLVLTPEKKKPQEHITNWQFNYDPFCSTLNWISLLLSFTLQFNSFPMA